MNCRPVCALAGSNAGPIAKAIASPMARAFISAAALLCAIPSPVQAQATAPVASTNDSTNASADAAPSYTLSTNLAITSQYVFRGISYSQKRPALQGGFDFVHSNGLYAGVWGSTVSGQALLDAVAEFDFYGGYTGSVGDLAYDVGLLQFTFPRGRVGGERYDTLEAYASLTWQVFNLKYSRTVGDYFGMNANSMGSGDHSRGSGYLEANVNWTFSPTWALNLHTGRQHVKGYERYSFTDYKVGVTKDLAPGWQLSLAAAGSNGKADLYRVDGVNTAGDKWIAMLKRTF